MIKLNWWQKALFRQIGRGKINDFLSRVLTVPGVELADAAAAAGVAPVDWRKVEAEQAKRAMVVVDQIFS